MGTDLPAGLGIAIDRAAELPIGVQLTWGLRALILTGTLTRGDQLPALHRLAGELGVNANTVRAAYARLELEGLVETRHGSGTFVGERPGSRVGLADAVASAAQAAGEAGVSAREVAAALYVASAPPAGTDPAAGRRRQLRAEIAVLHRSLSELQARARLAPPAQDRARRPGSPRLLTADELEAQRDHVLRQLLAARADADRRADPPGGEPAADATESSVPKAKRSPGRAPKPRLRVASEKPVS
jgi:DNA-binding transcriptional regulator YhcF (GntR family)